MSNVTRFVRYIVFCVFFAVGIGAIAMSFLTKNDLSQYFQSRAGLEKILRDNEKLQSLISQYQDQITLIEREPNVLKRLQDVALGRLPEREDVVYPSDFNPQLTAAARQALEENPMDPNAWTPTWVKRCNQPKMQSTLFMSGAGLILITFMLFGGSARPYPNRKDRPFKSRPTTD